MICAAGVNSRGLERNVPLLSYQSYTCETLFVVEFVFWFLMMPISSSFFFFGSLPNLANLFIDTHL